MKLIACYLLAKLGGNESPKAKDIKQILASVGIEADAKRLDSLIKELDGKSIEDIIAEGSSKLSSIPSGGATAPASSAAPAAGGKAEEKKAAKVEEKEESDEDMGFGLFD